MSKEILLVVDAVSNEKGVEKDIIFEAIEAALASATRRRHGEDIEVRVAIDRETGSTRWSTTVREEVPHEGTHRTGSMAAGSPITDGAHLYAFFGSRGLYCLDLDGNVKWENDLGNQTTRNSFGEGASPALYGDTIVVPEGFF